MGSRTALLLLLVFLLVLSNACVEAQVSKYDSKRADHFKSSSKEVILPENKIIKKDQRYGKKYGNRRHYARQRVSVGKIVSAPVKMVVVKPIEMVTAPFKLLWKLIHPSDK